jgi:hypothetical protein
VHECTGTHRHEYVLTTNMTMKPQQTVASYTHRWSIATTFEECREYLKLEPSKGYSQQTVLRFSPCLLGLYTLVVLLSLQLLRPSSPLSAVFQRGKSTVTLAGMMTHVRHA